MGREKILDFVFITSPLIFIAYTFTLKNITQGIKIGVGVICILITLFNIFLLVRERKKREERWQREKYYHRLYEKTELWDRESTYSILELFNNYPLVRNSFQEGQNYEKEYNFTLALKVYEEKLKNSSLPEEVKSVFSLFAGCSCLYLADYRKAEYYFKDSLNKFKKIRDKTAYLPVQSLALENLGMIYYNLGKPDKALQYYQLALEVYRKFNYERGIAGIYNHLAVIYGELGKPEEGQRLLKESLVIFEKLDDQKNRAISLNNLGYLYLLLGKWEEALEKCRLALFIFQENQDEIGIANIFNHMGLIYNKSGDLKQAEQEYQRSLKINQRIRYKEGIVTNLGNLGLLNLVSGRSEVALEYFKKALEVIEDIELHPRKEILRKLINIIQSGEKETIETNS
ncbi:MAG: hypothetical protein Kow00103_03440 [Candidatus Caldatribacteriota bacterium]